MIKKKSLGVIFSLSILALGTGGFSTFILGTDYINTVLNVNTGDVYDLSSILSFKRKLSSLVYTPEGFLEDDSLNTIGHLTSTITIDIAKSREMPLDFVESGVFSLNLTLKETGNVGLLTSYTNESSLNINLIADSMGTIPTYEQNPQLIKDGNNIKATLNIDNIRDDINSLDLIVSYTIDASSATNFETDVYQKLASQEVTFLLEVGVKNV